MRDRATLIAFLLLIPAALFMGRSCAVAADPISEWHDLYDGGTGQSDAGRVALTDSAGNLIIAGESTDGIIGVDMLIRKLERATGDTIWTHRVSAPDNNDMQVGGMVWDGFGNLLIGGTRLGCFG